jgi:hypothetical protein
MLQLAQKVLVKAPVHMTQGGSGFMENRQRIDLTPKSLPSIRPGALLGEK